MIGVAWYEMKSKFSERARKRFVWVRSFGRVPHLEWGSEKQGLVAIERKVKREATEEQVGCRSGGEPTDPPFSPYLSEGARWRK